MILPEMRKILIHRPGGHHRLVIEQAPTPDPGPGQVLIEVEAIGVNYADRMVRMGLYKSARDHVGWPVCPGFEVAGRVAALGPAQPALRCRAHRAVDLPHRHPDPGHRRPGRQPDTGTARRSGQSRGGLAARVGREC